MPELNSMRDDLANNSVGSSLFENSLQSNKQAFSIPLANSNHNEVTRLREELASKNNLIVQATKAWKIELDECNRKVSDCLLQLISEFNNSVVHLSASCERLDCTVYDFSRFQLAISELQRDKAKEEILEWKSRLEAAQQQQNMSRDLRGLSIQNLKLLQVSLNFP